MFKKSLALLAVTAAIAAPSVQADSKNVDMYGVVAYGYMADRKPETATKAADTQWIINNESRIGFRGSRQFKNVGPKFIWQIESGFLGGNGLGGQTYSSGALGVRDTFAGFEGGFGKIRFGRVLTPFFEALDWPVSNGGIGPITDSIPMTAGGNLDRNSNTFRWDSPAGGTVSGAVSVGRGATTGGTPNGGDPAVKNSNHVSALVSIKAGPANIRVGYEKDHNRASSVGSTTGKADSDEQQLGFDLALGGGFSTYGAYVKGHSEVEDGGDEFDRHFIQLALVYGAGDWIFKVTGVKLSKEEVNGTETGVDGSITAVQALYILDPSAVAFVRMVRIDSDYALSTGYLYDRRLLIGMEYYF